MTAIDRVRSLSWNRLTERQARFLVTVMQHSGVCLPRQYAAFAGIVHGQKTVAFFDRLARCRYAVTYPCRHHRGRIYHVRYKPLYRAIGDTDSRFRRSMSAAQVADRLATLDAIISTPNVTWLGSAEDRRARFGDLPEVLSRVPVGVDQDGRVVLLFVVMKERRDEFRALLQRSAGFLSTLPGWTVRVVFGPQFGWLSKQYDETFREELATPLPRHVDHLRWYFKQRQAASADPAAIQDEEGYYVDKYAYSAPRFRELYRRWLKEGESALEVVSSPALADAIVAATGRLECAVLPFSYRHLSPLVDGTNPVSRGADEGDENPTRLQPLAERFERLARICAERSALAGNSTSEAVVP